jgi:GAF domain-containing protein
MGEQSREERLSAAFVELADTLVGDFDVIHFLHVLVDHCVGLLDISAAGVLLAAPPPGRMVLDAAASNERTRALEADGVDWGEGPCHTCYRTGQALSEVHFGAPAVRRRWPRFTRRARELGFTSAAAVPLRLRLQVIGALNLYSDHPRPLTESDLRLAQALADTATIGLLQQRANHANSVLNLQLHQALTSRIVIEQAKGMLAQQWNVSVDDAFDQLRAYARHHQRLLTQVARSVLDGTTHLNPREPGRTARPDAP